jgi:hypothetical protein
MSTNLFREFWKAQNGNDIFEKKVALTKAEIVEVQNKIAELQKKGFPSSKIITALQKFNSKLSERWKAERAYWTETKVDDTDLIGEAGDDLGISRYKVILSPNPCPICVKKTSNGNKLFKAADLNKSGYGHVPPFHPNCYCIIFPFD